MYIKNTCSYLVHVYGDAEWFFQTYHLTSSASSTEINQKHYQ